MQVNKNDFTYVFEETLGIKHLDRKKIKLDEVYTGEIEHNVGRVHGAIRGNVVKISESLKSRGVIYSMPLPVVEKLQTPLISKGKKYYYKLIDGNNRYKAFVENKYNEWVFDVIKIGVDSIPYKLALHTFAQIRNDHAHAEPHKSEDVIKAASELIADGLLIDNEKAIEKWVYDCCKNMRTQTKNQIIQDIIKLNDIPVSTIGWRDDTGKDWVENVYSGVNKVDCIFAHHYFADRIYSLCKKYAVTNEVQNVALHVDGKDAEAIKRKRSIALEDFTEFQSVIMKVAGYVMMNGKLPFNYIGFMPQIKEEEPEDDFVKVA